ncbi:hypothetical protein J0910_04260 [Nocardiopsis sp. CNT-189]|uniref:hypothetical protein n=1 Tax=Nocardiopsis oceanisediminis TaxID=2816862 RepID=UPI003B37E0DD
MPETSAADPLRSADGGFVPVSAWSGGFADPDRIDGAIVLSVDGQVFLDEDYGDLVDRLWAYILTMLEEPGEKDSVEAFFPGRPLRLAFRRVGGGRLPASVGR